MEESILFYDKYDNLILNTYSDFHLLIQELTIPTAQIKEEIVEIPGSSDVLDYTESLTGDVNFQRRPIPIELAGTKSITDFLNIHSQFQNKLHGKKVKMIFSEEPSFYWIGRVSVGEVDPYEIIRKINLEIIVDPYKYEIHTSAEDWLWDPFSFEDGIINETKDLIVDGELEVNIYGRRKLVSPKFTCECQDSLQCIFEGQTYNFINGTNYAPNIQIKEGQNTFKFIGNGKVTIEYRGGSL